MNKETGIYNKEQGNQRIGRLGWSILFVLTAVAFVMRFYRLESLPPGLFYDEAFNGLDGWKLSQLSISRWPVFLTGNQGREALYVWLMALLHRVNGLSVWTIRAVPALCGALLTPALVWLAWEVARLSSASFGVKSSPATVSGSLFSSSSKRSSGPRSGGGGRQTADRRPRAN